MRKFTDRLRLRASDAHDCLLMERAADIIDELENVIRDMVKHKRENRNGLTFDLFVPYRLVDNAIATLERLNDD